MTTNNKEFLEKKNAWAIPLIVVGGFSLWVLLICNIYTYFDNSKSTNKTGCNPIEFKESAVSNKSINIHIYYDVCDDTFITSFTQYVTVDYFINGKDYEIVIVSIDPPSTSFPSLKASFLSEHLIKIEIAQGSSINNQINRFSDIDVIYKKVDKHHF